MKRILLVVALTGVVAAAMVPASMASSGGGIAAPVAARATKVSSFANTVASRPAAVPGEIVVTYRHGLARAARTDLASRMGARVIATVPRMGVETLRLPAGASVDASIRRLPAHARRPSRRTRTSACIRWAGFRTTPSSPNNGPC